ncbi:GH23631, partial [Drosophila grimshawi]
STDSIEPDETEESEGPGTLDEEEPMLISSEDEKDTGEERRSSTSPVSPDDEETMPWPPETPDPEVIVISDEEEEEAQGQGERPQIPPPTRGPSPGVCLGGGGRGATHLAAGGGTPTRRHQPPAATTEPNTARRKITTTPAAGVETPIPAPGVVPRGGTPTHPTDAPATKLGSGRRGWMAGAATAGLAHLASRRWPMPSLDQADGRPESCGRRSTAIV